MNSGVTAEDMKRHLRIDNDAEAESLEDYIAAAEAHVASHLRRDLDTEFDGDTWPKQAMQAVRLLAAHFYTSREAVIVGTSSSELPLGVNAILAPLRDLS